MQILYYIHNLNISLYCFEYCTSQKECNLFISKGCMEYVHNVMLEISFAVQTRDKFTMASFSTDTFHAAGACNTKQLSS